MFPVLKESGNAREDPNDALSNLYDALSPFSLSVDELFEDQQRGDDVITESDEDPDVAQSDANVCEVAKLSGLQDVSDVSEDEEDCKIDEPPPEKVYYSHVVPSFISSRMMQSRGV